MKIYKSNSLLHINVALPDGGFARVSFTALSSGGSVYYCSDEDIQEGLEQHSKFGKLFFLDSELSEDISDDVSADDENKVLEFKTVEVKDLTEAKDYLANNFGFLRSKLKSRTQIENAGKTKGVTFVIG